MPGWLPTTATPKGRLVLAALELFGERGFDGVGVGELAAAASTTTGPLYHHFGTKLGLYQLVRRDVEQRVVDRMQGALEADAGVTAALLVGFRYTHRAGFLRLLGEPSRDPSGDPIEQVLATHVGQPLAQMLLAAWRQALLAAAAGAAPQAIEDAIAALRGGPDARS